MGLLFRYVLLRYLVHLLFITALMVGLYLAVDTPERLGEGAAAILARVPLMLVHVLPVSAGAALLTAFGRMRASGALVTLRASGVSWARILAPVAAAGLGAAALEAALSLAGAPAALAASTTPLAPARPAWVLSKGRVVHVDGKGAARAWEPGGDGVELPVSLEGLEGDIEALATRPPVEAALITDLVRIARLERRLGHDPRAEIVEAWTRILLPCALLLVLVTCAVSVRRDHRPWRGAARLVVAFVAGWLCLAAATQLFMSGVVPGWVMLALPMAALVVCAAL
jgi:lipopolysaccharide export LptBFGC system permease protein LptF